MLTLKELQQIQYTPAEQAQIDKELEIVRLQKFSYEIHQKMEQKKELKTKIQEEKEQKQNENVSLAAPSILDEVKNALSSVRAEMEKHKQARSYNKMMPTIYVEVSPNMKKSRLW